MSANDDGEKPKEEAMDEDMKKFLDFDNFSKFFDVI
jgi:hypothetical protein